MVLMFTLSAVSFEAQSVQTSAEREKSEKAEENKKLARRYFGELLNQGKIEVADEILAADLIVHPPGSSESLRGLENFKQLIRGFRQAIPDIQFTEEAIMADGDRVAVQIRFSGTHTGAEWMGLAPKGGRVSINGVDVFRVAGGKIQELWIYFDTRTYLAQLKGETGS